MIVAGHLFNAKTRTNEGEMPNKKIFHIRVCLLAFFWPCVISDAIVCSNEEGSTL